MTLNYKTRNLGNLNKKNDSLNRRNQKIRTLGGTCAESFGDLGEIRPGDSHIFVGKGNLENQGVCSGRNLRH